MFLSLTLTIYNFEPNQHFDWRIKVNYNKPYPILSAPHLFQKFTYVQILTKPQ